MTNETRGFDDWDRVYRENPIEDLPWYSPEPDEDLIQTLTKYKIAPGTFLDIGTGPGVAAVAAAERGFQVTAIDISARAVELARSRAGMSANEIDFRTEDILQTRLSPGQFDVLFDRGCFHTLAPSQWSTYVDTVRVLIREDGYLLVKTFSWRQRGKEGPRRFHPEELSTIFSRDFDFLELRDSAFRGHGEAPQALFAVLRPRKKAP